MSFVRNRRFESTHIIIIQGWERKYFWRPPVSILFCSMDIDNRGFSCSRFLLFVTQLRTATLSSIILVPLEVCSSKKVIPGTKRQTIIIDGSSAALNTIINHLPHKHSKIYTTRQQTEQPTETSDRERMNCNSLRRTANLLRTRHMFFGRNCGNRCSSTIKTNPTIPRRLRASLSRGFSTRLLDNHESTSACTSLPAETTTIESTVVPRRGLGDAIVTVTVGDKKFKTLKSTLQLSPVIWDALLRAEEQQPQQESTNLFLDRDPKHFPTILAYLRNKVDKVSYNRECHPCKPRSKPREQSETAFFQNKHHHTKYIRIPKDADPADLEDLYLEATYYQLEDLKTQLAHGTFVLRASQVLGGTTTITNPFERTKELVKTLRNASVAVAGMGTGAAAYLTDTTNSVTTMALSFVGS